MKTKAVNVETINSLKVNVYNLLSDCIDRGIDIGYRRAHKHTETPGEDIIKESIFNEVTNQICEYFVFEDYYKE